MPETISIDDQKGIILIESRGHLVVDDLAKSKESVLQIVKTKGLKKVMIDATNQKSLPSTMSLHSFASELPKLSIGLRQAIVISEQTPKDMKFIETVSLNRGASIKIFSSRENALSWLQL